MSPSASEIESEFDLFTRILEYLAGWGLQSFPSEDAYYAWQRQVLSSEQLQRLHDLAEKRRGDEGVAGDRAFYDLAASSDLLPVLYSQRFGYYQEVGIAMARQLSRLPAGASVLDVGCGVGILTTWYAMVFPHLRFQGIDRSSSSLEAAGHHAAGLNLMNLTFTHADLSQNPNFGAFDGIIATQSLFQSEIDPGLPSQSWRTFERAQDESLQVAAEVRTGLGVRLDGLVSNLKPQGSVFLFEKTVHLGRRVLFQRAMMRRGFGLVHQPHYLQFLSLGELETEGPLYVMSQKTPWLAEWDESPRIHPMEGLYRCGKDSAGFLYSKLNSGKPDLLWSSRMDGRSLSGMICSTIGGLIVGCVKDGESILGMVVGGGGDEGVIRDLLQRLQEDVSRPKVFEQSCNILWPAPLDPGPVEVQPIYENHTSVAHRVWEELIEPRVIQSHTFEEEDGRGRYIELGICRGGEGYVYWANTYDQRQIVMMETGRTALLREYFEESVNQH